MPNDDQNRPTLCILHLEDSLNDHALVLREFQRSGEAVTLQRVESLGEFENALKTAYFDVILADYRLPGFTALDAWQLMNHNKIRRPFILLSGAIGESAAVKAIQMGISDYLPKDDLSKIRHITQRAIEMHRILIAKETADTELAHSERQLASFAEHLQMTIENERAAIAREIHDDIGGSLAAIRFDLSWIERHTVDKATLDHVQTATDMLHHAVQASQRIMMNLRPAILDQGLAAAIQWLANNFSKRSGIETLVQAQLPTEQLSRTIQLTAYRTAQEALTNVSKYAQCSLVKIELTGDDRFVTLEITDNGCGMNDSNLALTTGFGIKGLKERAKTIGGWVDVSSKVGFGTSITLSIPIPDGQVTTEEH